MKPKLRDDEARAATSLSRIHVSSPSSKDYCTATAIELCLHVSVHRSVLCTSAQISIFSGISFANVTPTPDSCYQNITSKLLTSEKIRVGHQMQKVCARSSVFAQGPKPWNLRCHLMNDDAQKCPIFQSHFLLNGSFDAKMPEH